MKEDRLATGVPGLDDLLSGGLQRGDSALVAGSPGTGKTTLGLHFLAAGVAAGEPGVFVTFEYLPQQLYRDAERRGWPLRKWEQDGMLRVVCTAPEILLSTAAQNSTILDEVLTSIRARRVVIDSMTQFEMLGQSGPQLRATVAGLINHLRLVSVTPLLTLEIPQIVGPTVAISSYGLEFVADTIIVLRYVELDGALAKVVNVMKFRGGAHATDYRSVHLGPTGMKIGKPLGHIENITGGTARRVDGDRLQRIV